MALVFDIRDLNTGILRYVLFFFIIFDYKLKLMFLYFKVNEHLKDIMEQEQKLKDHHAVETLGGQKVRTCS